jgi:hypothetical protein
VEGILPDAIQGVPQLSSVMLITAERSHDLLAQMGQVTAKSPYLIAEWVLVVE